MSSSRGRTRVALGLLLAAAASATAVAGGAWVQQVAADAHLAAVTPTPIVYDRAGRFLTQAGHADGARVEYGFWDAAAPPRVVAATLALEDRRFATHPGIDPLGVARALLAHLRGGRSGASTVAELAAIGRPAILVPLPGALDQDQAANARSLEAIGAATVIRQPDFTPGRLAAEVASRLAAPERLAAAAAAAKGAGVLDAAERLAAVVLTLAKLDVPGSQPLPAGQGEAERRAASVG